MELRAHVGLNLNPKLHFTFLFFVQRGEPASELASWLEQSNDLRYLPLARSHFTLYVWSETIQCNFYLRKLNPESESELESNIHVSQPVSEAIRSLLAAYATKQRR